MNFIDGYLNRKFKKARLEKYFTENSAEYTRNNNLSSESFTIKTIKTIKKKSK